MKKLLTLFALGLFAASAFAADLSGKWMTQLTSPGGQLSERIFNLQVTEGKLTGSITNFNVANATFEQPGQPMLSGILKTQNGKPAEILEGQVTGDDITFTVGGMMAGNQVKFVYTGKLTGDELKLKLETKVPEGAKTPGGTPLTPPAAQEMTAKRLAK